MDEKLDVATTVDRMTVAPVLYDCIAIRYSAAAPSGGSQAITLDSQDYEAFSKGHGEQNEDSGMTIDRDGMFTNLYKNGGFDRSQNFEIYGIGVAFTGTPFVGTGGLDSGTQIIGTLVSAAEHAENLANLAMMQLFVEVGASEEDCVSLAGPIGLWDYGGYGLGDNAVSPRILNALVGNERRFRFALLNEPVRKDASDANITVRIRRSEKIAMTYSTTSPVSGGASDVAYLMHVFAFGRRV